MNKICEQCGESFEPVHHHPNQRFCSSKCRAKWETQNQYNAAIVKCQGCGNTYKPKRSDRNKYCSRECAFKFLKALRGIEPVFVSVCLVCGCHSKTVACSDACQQALIKEQGRLRGIATKVLKERPCKQCGTVFTPEYGNKRRTYCSARCLRRAAKGNGARTLNARGRKAIRTYYGDMWQEHYEPINARKVFTRDKFRCQLCSRKVIRGGGYHPLQATVDHIVPLALGGNHKYANVQTACQQCNTNKGATVAGQLRLIG